MNRLLFLVLLAGCASVPPHHDFIDWWAGETPQNHCHLDAPACALAALPLLVRQR